MKKEPRLYDPGYLRFLRTHLCCLCGRHANIEAAHIRIGLLALGRKPDDRYAVPMCRHHHVMQHSMNEIAFWADHNADPFDLAAHYYGLYGGTGGKPRTKKPKYKWPKRKIQNRSKR